jgi:hypothetical protein
MYPIRYSSIAADIGRLEFIMTGGGASLQDSGVVLPLNPHVMFDILPEACRSGHSGEWVLMVLR